MGVFPELAVVQGSFPEMGVKSPLHVIPFRKVRGKGFLMQFELGSNSSIC